jgi:hypothetical protein
LAAAWWARHRLAHSRDPLALPTLRPRESINFFEAVSGLRRRAGQR